MAVPTLYDWIGGTEALERLTEAFYEEVRKDDVLPPVFANMDADHPAHVAAFVGEVFGGPPIYSERHGEHPEMIRHHLNRHLTEAQRRRWMSLLMDVYTELGLPHDPEFGSALVGYLEWGTRLAVMNSQPGASVDEAAPMPTWGWGETGGPYVPSEEESTPT